MSTSTLQEVHPERVRITTPSGSERVGEVEDVRLESELSRAAVVYVVDVDGIQLVASAADVEPCSPDDR